MTLRKLGEMMDCNKVQLVMDDGMVNQRVELADNDIRFRARVAVAKIHGCEPPVRVEGDIDVNHNYRMDFRNAKEEDIDIFLQFCAAAFPGGLSARGGREVQAEPIDVAPR
jgi:hypothetical protein